MSFFDELDKFSDHTAAIDSNGKSYTYSELAAKADRIGSHLPRDSKRLVFILCGNNVETLAGYLGVLRSGHTGVMLAANTETGLLANLMDLYQPDYIWTPSDSAGKLVYSNGEYSLVDRGVEREQTIYPDLSLMLSTSGSTGSPKMVPAGTVMCG